MKLPIIAAGLTAALLCTTPVIATVVIPGNFPDGSADTFGSLPGATFGGSGIPNNAVAISTFVDGANTITLGLSATPRFGSPTPTNDGMGGFTVQAGESDPGLSLWNFSFYADIAGPGSFADYSFDLAYDLDSGSGTDLANHGTLSLNAFAASFVNPDLSMVKTYQDSQNAGFGFLAAPFPGAVIPPTPPQSFDASELGEYTFALRVTPGAGFLPIDQVSISVAAIPEPSALLFGSLIAGSMGLAVNRRRRQSTED